VNAQIKEQPQRLGIFTDEPAEAYYQRRLDVASASGMKVLLRSPAHFKHWCEHPDADRDSDALTFGKAFHCATLEPEVFVRQYAVVESGAPRYPTAAQWNAKGKRSPDSQAAVDYWSAWNANNAGRTRLSQADYDRARHMADSVRRHPVAKGLLIGGDRETTFRWQDEETGIECKARADLYAGGEFLMDLKTCRDASHEGFARSVASYAYDLQAAHYLDGIRSNGDSIKWFVFLACESEAPYVCQPYILDAAAETRGFDLRMKALRRQRECLDAGHWPGYSEQLSTLTLPAWAFFGIEQ
jgi:hypothetical protein